MSTHDVSLELKQRTTSSSLITIDGNVEIVYDAITRRPAGRVRLTNGAMMLAFTLALSFSLYHSPFIFCDELFTCSPSCQISRYKIMVGLVPSVLTVKYSSRSPIRIMSRYLNPLHAPVPSEFHSKYTSLSHANPPLEPPFPTSFPSTYRRVPQTPPSPRSGSHVPIIFELIGAPSRGLGIPMRELVVRSGGALERMIVDASEPVGYLMSGPLGIRQVSLRIRVLFALARARVFRF